MFDKVRTEVHASLEFQPADKLGFATESVDDWNIKSALKDLRAHCNSGALRGVPANVDIPENVHYAVLGAEQVIASLQANIEATKAAVAAGTPVYDTLATFTRIFEQGDGQGRPGRKRASFAGLDAPASEDPLIS